MAKENNVEGTRAYMVRIRLRDGSKPPRIIDAAWLDRYSGRSLSGGGGTLECIGLAAGEGGDAGGAVAYATFGPAGGRGGQVTLSAVGLAPADSAGWPSRPSRVKDLDLDSNIVPSAVAGRSALHVLRCRLGRHRWSDFHRSCQTLEWGD